MGSAGPVPGPLRPRDTPTTDSGRYLRTGWKCESDRLRVGLRFGRLGGRHRPRYTAVLLLLPLLSLTPRLLLPPLVKIDGAIVPLLEKLDPLLFDEPEADELEVLVELNAESEMSLCAQTPSTSRVFVSGTCSATVRTRLAMRSTVATISSPSPSRKSASPTSTNSADTKPHGHHDG